MKTIFNNPFNISGKWYKGNLHAHTNNSDGCLSPYEVLRHYRSNGYSFICITDHDKLTLIADNHKKHNNFLHINGEEISFTYRHNLYHLLAIDINKEIHFPEIEKKEHHPKEIIDIVKEYGGESVLAHPYWSQLTINETKLFEECLGIEIFTNAAQIRRGNGYATVHWDELLNCGNNIYGFAVDDAHCYGINGNMHNEYDFANDSLGGWIMVKASSLEKEIIVNQIKQGYFYSSSGPEIKNVFIKNDTIYLETSNVKTITFCAPGTMAKRLSRRDNKPINNAHFTISGDEKYIRLECMDYNFKMAWTNPIFF